MIEWIKSRFSLKADSSDEREYEKCVCNLIGHKEICRMKDFIQHGDISCFEHSLSVSYSSYLICRRLKLDYRSAARGGLLHDFFLYDWHGRKPYKGLHGFIHPRIALQNADKYFELNALEREIIYKHMWPLTLRLPRHKEVFAVAFADKYCALLEILCPGERKNIMKLKELAQVRAGLINEVIK